MNRLVLGAALLCFGAGVWGDTISCGTSTTDTGCSSVDQTFSGFNSPDIDPPDGNLVQNGGFETGDLTGWTLTNASAYDAVCQNGTLVGGSQPCEVNSGNYAMNFGNPGGATGLSQTLATTPGTDYTLDFYLANVNPGDTGITTFQVMWDGSIVYSLSSPQPTFPYTLVSLNVSATSSSTDLEFLAEQQPVLWFLDDVSLDPAAVPEPASMLLVGCGLLACGFLHRNRRKSTQAKSA